MRILTRVLLLTVVGLLLLVGANHVLAVSDTYGGVYFHPFTMDPDNNTCTPWMENGSLTHNCDPVNLIFADQTVSDVQAELDQRNWTTSGFGSNQLIHFQDEDNLLTQDMQLYRSEGLSSRYHLRLWQVPGNIVMTLGAVHHESGILVHTIDQSWENSEGYVAGLLCGSDFSCDQTGELYEQYYNIQGNAPVWRGWENNGSASIIRPVTGSDPRPPTAMNDSYIVVEDTPLDVNAPGVLANDSDADGDPLTASLVSGSANGNLNLRSDGSFTYTPDTNFDGIDSFTYVANDGSADSNEAMVTINITPVNDPPEANFTFFCTNLSCSFNGVASADGDGNITSYIWDFGDGQMDSGVMVDHTYSLANSYNVILTVGDDELFDSDSQVVTISEADDTTMHVADLDGVSVNQRKNWTGSVTITIHDTFAKPVVDAVVNGSWNGTSGESFCITDLMGVCSITSDPISKKRTSVDFNVDGVTHGTLNYSGNDNHDPDGDSDGSNVTIPKDALSPPPPDGTSAHVGDLDGTSRTIGRNKWKATVNITIHDNNENPAGQATITGQWSGDYSAVASCTTDGSGHCSLSTANLDGSGTSVTFTVSSITHGTLIYDAMANHDDEVDSDGNNLIINHP